MPEFIIYYLFGCLKLKIYGKEVDRVINLCLTNRIPLKNIINESEYFECLITIKNFKRLLPFIRKTKTTFRISDKYGLPFLIFKNRHRKCYIIGFFICIFLVVLSTLFVWDISISGESTYSKNEIIEYLNSNGLNQITLKSNIDCNMIAKDLYNHYENIGWISCYINGTMLCIDINETNSDDSLINSEEISPCDVISDIDCEIASIYVRDGKTTLKEHDNVKKGDILISGTVDIKNEYDEVCDTVYVHADGDVIGRYEINYNDRIEYIRNIKEYTNINHKKYRLHIGYMTLELPSYSAKSELFDTEIYNYKLKLGKTFYIPLSYDVINIKEYTINTTKLTNEEAKEIAEKRLNEYIDVLNKKGVEIIENNVKIKPSDSYLMITGNLIVEQKIGVSKLIDTGDTIN